MYANQRKVPQPSMSQNESEARSKLAQYVYEYLCQNGAPKAAETFKSEIQSLSEMPPINFGDGPGFLYNWWSVFWDLYSATPDRRDKADPTLEAKAFVDLFHGYGPGMNGQFPGAPMNVPPHGMDPSMMGNFYRPPQPNVGPSSQSSPIPGYQNSFAAPSRFPHPMGPRPGMPPQMAGPNGFGGPGYPPNVVPNRMPANPRQLNFQNNMRGMRPGMYGPPFMDSPTTPTFPPQGGLMQNGGPMNGPGISMSMMSGPNGPNHDPQYFGNMNQQFPMMCDPSGSGTPNSTSAGPTSVPGISAPHSVPPNIGGPSSVGSGHGNMPASVSNDNPQMPGGSSLSNLLNGGDPNPDLKQSPSSIQGGVPLNGGTPAQHGPGSAAGIGPGSVHSQGAPNSVNTNININNPQLHSTPQSHAQLTPTSGPPDNILFDHQQNADGDHNDEGKEDEINKIKASLIEGFGDKAAYTTYS